MVRKNLRVAQSRWKSYADHRRRELSFEVKDYVYFSVSPMRGLRCFKVRVKLAPRFFGSSKITEEKEEKLKAKFLNFFSNPFKSRGQDSF
jgi:hypothetical protein